MMDEKPVDKLTPKDFYWSKEKEVNSLIRRLQKLEKHSDTTPNLVVTCVPPNPPKNWRPETWSRKQNTVIFSSGELARTFRPKGDWEPCEQIAYFMISGKKKK